jgi:predicted dehydrogenase
MRPGIEYHPTAKWFLDSQIAGAGLVLDWGVYDLSFHLGLLDDKPEIESIETVLAGKLDRKDPGTDIYDTEEHAISLLKFKDGLRYYWERAAHSNVEVPNETRIYGTRGGLKFSFLSWNSAEVTQYMLDEDENAVEEVLEVDMEDHPGDGYTLIEHFIKVLDEKEEPMMTLEIAAKNLDIIFRAYKDSEKLTNY